MRKVSISIGERLKEVRTYDLYTQKYIASILKIKQPTYASYESNKRIIPLKHLNTLSQFYDLSIDYLLGLNNKTLKKCSHDLDINVSSKNFFKVRKENNLSQEKMAKILNISETTVRDYENQKYFLSTHVCYDLARNFNISVDWLLGMSNKKEL